MATTTTTRIKDRHQRQYSYGELVQAIRASDSPRVELMLLSGSISPEIATRALAKHAVLVRGDNNDASSSSSSSSSSAGNMVRLLLHHGAANSNHKLSYGMTTLHSAVKNNNNNADPAAAAAVVGVLLQEGRADPNLPDEDGHTPLHLASVRNQIHVGKVLLEHGADMMMADHSGWTVLETSLLSSSNDNTHGHGGQAESVSFLRLLLERGGNANYRSREQNGNSLLHMAAAQGRSQAIQVLLEFGANATARNVEGKVPLQVACENGFVSCILLLLQHMNADGSIRLIKRKK